MVDSKKQKHIWIINEYAGSPEYGMTFRHYYLAKEFVAQGMPTTIISASYSHFLKKYPNMNHLNYQKENIDGIDYLWLKVLKYSKSFDKRRVLKWFQFCYRLPYIPKYIDQKPDVIICSPSAPFAILPSYFLAKRFKAKLIFEVRDIWPLTLVEIGHFSKMHPFIRFMGWFERFALNKSDVLVSNLQNYSNHIQDIGINRTAHWVSNGIDLDSMKINTPVDVSVAKQIPKNKFIVGYTGKLGVSNAVIHLIDAAQILKDHDDIIFVIVGDGQEKEFLQDYAKESKNIIFIDSIDKAQIQSMLSFFDVCFLGLEKENIFKYGTSPNKLFDYMYSGKPVLHSIETPKDIVSLCNCGVTVEPEDPQAIVNGIFELFRLSQSDRMQLGQNGKKYVLEEFTYKHLANKYIAIMNDPPGESPPAILPSS